MGKTSAIILASSAVVFAGCLNSDDVHIASRIYQDGSFDRSIIFSSTDSDHLHGRYILPEGAEWQVHEGQRLDGRTAGAYVYVAVGHFQRLESDYARYDQQEPPQQSRNRIEIQAADGACAYREQFTDTTQKERLRTELEGFIRQTAQLQMRHVAERLLTRERPQTQQRIMEGVVGSVLGWHDQLWRLYEAVNDEESRRRVLAWTDTAFEFKVSEVERWWKERGSFYAWRDGRQQIEQALRDWKSEEFEQLLASFEESVAPYTGAYGLYATDQVRFEVSVEMPSAITRSNAQEQDGNRATWRFTPMYLWLKPYTLEAESACEPGQE